MGVGTSHLDTQAIKTVLKRSQTPLKKSLFVGKIFFLNGIKREITSPAMIKDGSGAPSREGRGIAIIGVKTIHETKDSRGTKEVTIDGVIALLTLDYFIELGKVSGIN